MTKTQKTAHTPAMIHPGLCTRLVHMKWYSKEPVSPSVTVENVIAETDFVQKSAEKGPSSHSTALPENEPGGECCTTSNADDPSVSDIPFAVHPHGECQAADDTTDKNHVKRACSIC